MYAPDEVYLPPGITLSLICPSICIFGFSVLITQMEKREEAKIKSILSDLRTLSKKIIKLFFQV